jgi:hypothetical protein
MGSIGSIPTVSTSGTWSENVEVWDMDEDGPMDLSGVTEITLKLRDPVYKFDELVITMTGGDISIPTDGIIQWRVEVGQMGTLAPRTYDMIMLLEDGVDTVP